jgi:hypothetical protein
MEWALSQLLREAFEYKGFTRDQRSSLRDSNKLRLVTQDKIERIYNDDESQSPIKGRTYKG